MIARIFGNEDIHAYIDGGIDPARRGDVATWLKICPEAAMRAAFYARLNEMLHRRFDAILDEPVPEAWLRRLASRPRPTRRPWT